MEQSAASPVSGEFVTLAPGPKGGLTVPLDAFRLAHELIGRDLILSQTGETLRIKGPNGSKPELSQSEVERIKRWKFHLIAMLLYRAPEMNA